MTDPLVLDSHPTTRLDYSFLRRVCFGLGAVLILIAPSVRDPLAFAVGGMVPWAIVSIVGNGTMPAAIPYLLLWQWVQIFSRAILTLIDGESLASGVYGVSVARAYWYMLASVLVLACTFRFCLNNLPAPSLKDRLTQYEWRANDLFAIYIGGALISIFAAYAMSVVPQLTQQLEAVARVKAMALFLVFNTVLVTGVGGRLLVAIICLEVLVGFSGILSDFREVFIILAISALAARIKWTGTMTIAAIGWLGILIMLALFWTSVKADFRQFATGSDESQNLRTGLSERMGYLGSRALSVGRTDWGSTAYFLLVRLAYVDIFGAVITVQDVSPDAGSFGRQWSDAFSHVAKPRFLFPDKAALSDTEVYMRLAHGSVSEEMRLGTSISVGYMAENFADFGFPGMLLGMAALGLGMGMICRAFMVCRLPWALREGIVISYMFTIGRDGVEISLPKIIGGSIMFLLVYALLVRFVFPVALRWLHTRAEFREPQLS
jgi:hypothetical protein